MTPLRHLSINAQRGAKPRSILEHFWRCYHEAAETDQEVRSFLRQFNIKAIPRLTCEVTFSRSSGPGGQNVNKLNTKATLRLPSDKASWIPRAILDQLRSSNSQYLTKSGDVVIQSQRSRTQEQNKEDCFVKLADIISETGNANMQGETSEETKKKVKRMITRDNEQRIKFKKLRSAKKSARRGGSSE